MKVLVIGSGGREHALIWKLKQSPGITKLYCAPGNGGICGNVTCVPIPSNDVTALKRFAQAESMDLTVVGPEEPLTLGIADEFGKSGLPIFGPTARAAEIEGSKAFAKSLMKKYGIPTAEFEVFQDENSALRYVNLLDRPCVVKADGLAAGKGVIICDGKEDAAEAVRNMMGRKCFGLAAERLVIEERLQGEEISVFALTDGEDYVLLPAAQDHKRALDHDRGKNTGGMGSYAPVPHIPASLTETVERTVIQPVIRAMKSEGRTYQGVLYCGLMLTDHGPKVIEFNCRFGDPECQTLMPLIGNDLLELLTGVSRGNLKTVRMRFNPLSCVCVTLASGGYPDHYEKGKIITGIPEPLPPQTMIFHAGTQKTPEALITSGGRVLGVTSWAADLPAALRQAYELAGMIRFDGMHFRTDIGAKAIHPKPPAVI